MLPFRVFVAPHPRLPIPNRSETAKLLPQSSPVEAIPPLQPFAHWLPLHSPTAIPIPFIFNTFAAHRSRCGSTGTLLSSFLSSPCNLLPLQQGGTPPSPSSGSAHLLLFLPEITHIGEISTRPERLMPFTNHESLITGHGLPAHTPVPRGAFGAHLYFSRRAVRDSHPALRSLHP
jgi:hypothetical protein